MAKKEEPKKPEVAREYVIPLREKCRVVPRYKKTPKAVKTVKEFLVRHMKIRDKDLNKIKLDKYVNEVLWARGIKKPPIKIKVKAIKDGENIRVELVDYPEKLKFKKARAEKLEKTAEEKKKEIEAKKKADAEAQKPVEKTEEEKKEEKEKAASGAEATAKMEKAAAKTQKHVAGGKTKEPKHQQRKALAK